MNNFWNRISNTGIEPGMNETLEKKIKITNRIVFSLCIIATCYMFLFYLMGFKKEGVAVIIVVASMFLPIVLNYFKLFFLARTWFLIAINGAVLVYSYLFGIDAGIQLVYFSFVSIPWLIFEIHDWKYILSGVLIPISGYLLVNYNAGQPIVTITHTAQYNIYLTIVLVVFIILSLCMMFFVHEQMLSEEHLKVRNKRLEEIAWIQSHKFRKPVATILGLVQLIDSKDIGGENKTTIAYIKSASEELDTIINEIDSKTRT